MATFTRRRAVLLVPRKALYNSLVKAFQIASGFRESDSVGYRRRGLRERSIAATQRAQVQRRVSDGCGHFAIGVHNATRVWCHHLYMYDHE